MKALLVLAYAMIGTAWAATAANPPKQGAPPLPARRAIRIPVRSADPWFIKAMLEGQPLVSPELSTIFNLFGAPPGAAGQVNGLFTGGHFLVNPTDNSLWWYPDGPEVES